MAGAERRYNPLLGEWVLCSPGRLERPWRGESGSAGSPPREYDADCYMCPTNARSGGVENPDYEGVYVFDNDFPALDETVRRPAVVESPLFVARPERGRCRVLCFSHRHDLHFATIPGAEIRAVVDAWADEAERIRADVQAAYVQIFENRGAMMGASNPHPHGQIWAVEHVPTLPARKAKMLSEYCDEHARDLLGDYVDQELRRGERVVESGEHWVLVVPFWAVWPFETLLVPRRCVGRVSELFENERAELARLLATVTKRYDALFDAPFPYSFGWCERPEGSPARSFRLHAMYLPPLVRSASVRKYLVGYELTSEPQRDFLPEEAAERLRGALEPPV